MTTPQTDHNLPPDPTELLMQGAYPRVQFADLGDRFDGVLLDIKEPFHGRGFGKDKDKLSYWDPPQNTKPKWVIPFWFEADKDGQTYVLNVPQGSQMQSCIAAAILTAGERKPRKGGHISLALVDLKPTDGAHQKIYGAEWSAGMAGAGTAMATSPPQPVATPVSAPAATQPAVSQPQADPTSNRPVSQDWNAPQQQSTGLGDISQYPPEVQELMRQHLNKS